MVNQNKVYEVENLKAILAEAKSAALIDYQGLKAEQLRQLRAEVRERGGIITVAKNTLLALALKQLGIELKSPLTGPTALVTTGGEEIAPLKAVDGARKEWEKPVFKLGLYQGKLLSQKELEKLLSLPGRETLLAQFIGGLNNPLFRLSRLMKHHQGQFILVLKTLQEKKEEN